MKQRHASLPGSREGVCFCVQLRGFLDSPNVFGKGPKGPDVEIR